MSLLILTICVHVVQGLDFTRIKGFHQAIENASHDNLKDVLWLTNSIGSIGLHSEGSSMSLEDPSRPVHGDDSSLQISGQAIGLRAIPRQLASFLVELPSHHGSVRSLTIWGTGSGAWVGRLAQGVIHQVVRQIFLNSDGVATNVFSGGILAALSIYLQRFGLNWIRVVITGSAEDSVPPALIDFLMQSVLLNVTFVSMADAAPERSNSALNVSDSNSSSPPSVLPLAFNSSSPWEPYYHLVFVDSFQNCESLVGFQRSLHISRWVALHGIMGGGLKPCTMAIQDWQRLKDAFDGTRYGLKEFSFHSHGDKFMGIGLAEFFSPRASETEINPEIVLLAEEVGSVQRYHGRR